MNDLELSIDSKIESKEINNLFDTEEVLASLFNHLYSFLHEGKTNLRKYVDFISPDVKIPKTSKYWVFLKSGNFVYSTIDKTDFNIKFRGSVKKQASRQEVVSYVKDIVYGYHNNEEIIYQNFQENMNDLKAFCNEQIIEVKLKGLYFNHNLEFHDIGKENLDLRCNSEICFFIF